ncbi:MAG: CHRD domain-containing protein [Phenylobacterium sp.]
MSRPLIVALVAAAALGAASGANAALLVYSVALSGPNESPPNSSLGTGIGFVDIDTVANTMQVGFNFSGLSGTTTMSHIHCCTAVPGTGTASVATQLPTFTGFPLGVTAGTYLHTFDLTQTSTWNPAFVTASGGTAAGAEAAFIAGANAGEAYLNIHTIVVPGGEIRGFLRTVVPEPATWALMIGGFAIAGAGLRRRRAAVAA